MNLHTLNLAARRICSHGAVAQALVVWLDSFMCIITHTFLFRFILLLNIKYIFFYSFSHSSAEWMNEFD